MSEIKRKKSKRKVTFDDIKAVTERGNSNFDYFLKHEKLPFNR